MAKYCRKPYTVEAVQFFAPEEGRECELENVYRNEKTKAWYYTQDPTPFGLGEIHREERPLFDGWWIITLSPKFGGWCLCSPDVFKEEYEKVAARATA